MTELDKGFVQRVVGGLRLRGEHPAADLITHLCAEQAQVKQEREFPIGDGPNIPWSVIAPFDKQCQRQHGGQTLERLAQRGGLSVAEALSVLEGAGEFEAYWAKRNYAFRTPEEKTANILRLSRIVSERCGDAAKLKAAESQLATLTQERDAALLRAATSERLRAEDGHSHINEQIHSATVVRELRQQRDALVQTLKAVAESPQVVCDGPHPKPCDCVGGRVRAALASVEGQR